MGVCGRTKRCGVSGNSRHLKCVSVCVKFVCSLKNAEEKRSTERIMLSLELYAG